jgi:hypothetical protein
MPDIDNGKLIAYGVGVVFTIALAWALGYRGSTKGYSFWLCFMLCVFTSPIVGWIIVALLPEREQKYKTPPDLLLAIELERAKMKAAKEASP